MMRFVEVKQIDQRIRDSRRIGVDGVASEMNISHVSEVKDAVQD
jgi:hypothetical protein